MERVNLSNDSWLDYSILPEDVKPRISITFRQFV